MTALTDRVLKDEDLQDHVNCMTNWQRKQWGRVGYSRSPALVLGVIRRPRRWLEGAAVLTVEQAEEMVRRQADLRVGRQMAERARNNKRKGLDLHGRPITNRFLVERWRAWKHEIRKKVRRLIADDTRRRQRGLPRKAWFMSTGREGLHWAGFWKPSALKAFRASAVRH